MSEPGDEFKHAIKRMKHEIKHAEREKMHAIKYAFKHGAMDHEDCCYPAGPSPHSVEETLIEIDGYLSYLEDLPKERLAPYAGKVDRLVEHLDKVRSSLKNDLGSK
jgi:hypothetical protein